MSAKQDHSGAGSYKSADQSHQYEYDTGVIAVPLAGDEPGHRLIRLHGGIGMRRVNWTHTRTGNPPFIPTMEDTSGDTFLAGSVSPRLPTPSVTQNGYDWSVSGSYVYVQNTPRIVGQSHLPVGQHPFICYDQQAVASDLIGDAASSAYDADGFQGLIDAAEATLQPDANGSYTWPYLALPILFSSSSLIHD